MREVGSSIFVFDQAVSAADHDVTLRPKQGDIVFHPAIYTHPHAAAAVTKGEKYVCVFWGSLRAVDKQQAPIY